MVTIFPMPWSDFGGLLPLGPCVWRLRRFEAVTRTADSKAWVQELADPRWEIRATLGVMDHITAAEVEALIELHGSARPFLLHDPRRPGPRLDPDGAILGMARPEIHSVASAGFQIRALPPGYVLSAGDLISVEHGAGVGVYRVVSTTTADYAGITPLIHVTPQPRPIAAVNQTVRLINPIAQVIIDPDSYEPGEPDGYVQRGMRFIAVESW